MPEKNHSAEWFRTLGIFFLRQKASGSSHRDPAGLPGHPPRGSSLKEKVPLLKVAVGVDVSH